MAWVQLSAWHAPCTLVRLQGSGFRGCNDNNNNHNSNNIGVMIRTKIKTIIGFKVAGLRAVATDEGLMKLLSSGSENSARSSSKKDPCCSRS